MAALQVADLNLATAAPASGNALRVVDVTMTVTGNAPALTGTAPTGAVLAGSPVPLRVAVTGAYTSVDWEVLTTSAGIDLAGGDLERTFPAPYLTELFTIIVSVTATGPGGTSAPLLLKVTVVPHADWYTDGVTWLPITSRQVL